MKKYRRQNSKQENAKSVGDCIDKYKFRTQAQPCLNLVTPHKCKTGSDTNLRSVFLLILVYKSVSNPTSKPACLYDIYFMNLQLARSECDLMCTQYILFTLYERIFKTNNAQSKARATSYVISDQ